MKVKYKDQVIEVCEGATFEVSGGDLVITPKKQYFKDGDIVRTTHFIAIYKEATGIKLDFFNYVELEDDFDNDNVNELHYNSSLMPNELRFATKEERQKLFDALKSKGKKWNHETKQIEDILKVGDLAIFWDDDKSEACIATYNKLHFPHKYPDGFNFASEIKVENEYVCFKNAIKCTSLEQYINFIK